MVVAVPVGAAHTCEVVGRTADDLVCAWTPEPFAAVGQAYLDFRPTSDETEASLARSCQHHDEMIAALEERDEAAFVRLVFDHWSLSRWNMEAFISPKGIHSEAMSHLAGDKPKKPAKQRRSAAA